MAGATTSAAVLPKELMELQLGQIDLLMAMYPSEDDILLEDNSRELLGTLREWCDGSSSHDAPPSHIPPNLSFVLNLEVAAENPSSPSTIPKRLQLDMAWPLIYESADDIPVEPPAPKVRIRQPDWLSRAETSQLTAEMPSPSTPGDGGDGDNDNNNDILAIIEHIKDATSQHIATSSASSKPQDAANSPSAKKKNSSGDAGPPPAVVRAWFYFPSISTRAKRDDLVHHAPGYGLTGFLLAGKPGVLCLEGGARDIDAFMRFIKTESWGDIPAHHKKVSERWREEESESESGDGDGAPGRIGIGVGIKRAFSDMSEITETLGGARRGERANRNDMKALEAWLGERGLGEAFAKVLI